jgi:cytochrome c oxidase subunit 2
MTKQVILGKFNDKPIRFSGKRVMASLPKKDTRRVLIVSSHPLFGQGIRRLLEGRGDVDVRVVGMVSDVEQAVAALKTATPDLVVVDYDDERVNRDEFLAHFVEGAGELRVVLLSLKEGGSEAIVYDRRNLAAAQIDDWLKEWTYSERVVLQVVGEKNQRRANMKHFISAALLVGILTVVSVFALDRAQLLPVAASAQAGPIDQLFGLHFRIIAFLFALIVGLMLYSILVFRRKSGDDTDAEHIEGNTTLEVFWTIIPLGAVIYVAYLGATILGDITRPDPRPLEVKVIASQWSWRFEYPEWGLISSELVLPANKQALLKMISTDVIHSFWVPEFRVKQDILPGGDNMMRELRVTPNLEGEYKVRCAEMCGTLHANMEAPVIVVSQTNFETWVEEQSQVVPEDPIDRGRFWAQQYGCLACHSIDGTPLIGPTWQGVYMHEVLLDDGTTVIADEAYLYESIVNPGAQIVSGFANLMPAAIAEDMTDEQIAEVIEFIKSLE